MVGQTLRAGWELVDRARHLPSPEPDAGASAVRPDDLGLFGHVRYVFIRSVVEGRRMVFARRQALPSERLATPPPPGPPPSRSVPKTWSAPTVPGRAWRRRACPPTPTP